MRFDELALILQNIHKNMMERKEGGQSALLFGLYFSDEIAKINMVRLCESAGISPSYATEKCAGG